MEEIIELINDYSPSGEAIELLQVTPMALFTGITGSGRDTIISRLVQSGGYHPLITSTTRKRRMNNGKMEQSGVEYHFIDHDDAVSKIKNKQYIEVSLVHGHINGMLVDELERANQSGRIALTDVDDQGAFKYRQYSSNVTPLFIVPPSYDEWLSRVRNRYATEAEFMSQWPSRRKSALRELKSALEQTFYHYVINDDLEHTVELCDKIIHGAGQTDDQENVRARDIVQGLLRSIEADA